MPVDELKSRFAVIGHPIGHTMSPFIHQKLFELAGKHATYEVFDIAPENLEGMQKENLSKLDGYNITIPHKQAIIPLIDRLDAKAELYGSVNTVKNGVISVGYTTDPLGFVKALQNGGIALSGRVVILGCGGVARVMACEAALAGCGVTLAVRESGMKRAEALAEDVQRVKPGVEVSCCPIREITGHIDLLINGTPVGMYPKEADMPVEEKVLARTEAVFDSIYNPEETLLMRCARSNGSKVLGGMPMLVWQAVAAHEIWDGSCYGAQEIQALVEEASAEMNRIFKNK